MFLEKQVSIFLKDFVRQKSNCFWKLSFAITEISNSLKYICINCNNISQYYCFFIKINAALRKNIKKIVLIASFWICTWTFFPFFLSHFLFFSLLESCSLSIEIFEEFVLFCFVLFRSVGLTLLTGLASFQLHEMFLQKLKFHHH